MRDVLCSCYGRFTMGAKLRIVAPEATLGRKVPTRRLGGCFSLHTRPWLGTSEGQELALSRHERSHQCCQNAPLKKTLLQFQYLQGLEQSFYHAGHRWIVQLLRNVIGGMVDRIAIEGGVGEHCCRISRPPEGEMVALCYSSLRRAGLA